MSVQPRTVDRPPAGTLGKARLLPRQTFTIEVWIDDEAARVAAIQVVHLETQTADAWYGWDVPRLLGFLRTGIGIDAREPAPTAQDSTVDSGIPPTDAAPPDPPPLAVHRFGVLTADGLTGHPDQVAARLRLDPADLCLPPTGRAVAHVDLLARPLAGGPATTCATTDVELSPDRPVDLVIQGRTAARRPPYALRAAVRVLVDGEAADPRSGLGHASLTLVPDG